MFREHRNNYPDFFIDSRLELKTSKLHGTGVFAKSDIPAQTLIERSNVIKFSMASLLEMEENLCCTHILTEYVFQWPVCKDGGQLVLGLGFASLYNHSSHDDNVIFKPEVQREAIEFTTKRDIKAGEELLTRYIPRSCGGDNALFSLPFHPDDLPIDVDFE